MDEDSRIVALHKGTDDDSFRVTVRDVRPNEAIIVDLSDDVVAFENFCPHWTDIRLDKGSGAYVRNGELVCEKHGATFQRDTGYCDFGPCEGSVLSTFDVLKTAMSS